MSIDAENSSSEINTITKQLITNQIVRVILNLFVLFGTSIPLFMKILFIMVTDFLDILIPYPLPDNVFDEYEEYDKIGDMTIYTALWIYYLKYVQSPIVLKIYITLLFIYRWMGYLIYLENKDRKIFVFFPNAFLESLFIISFLEYLGYPYPKYFYFYVVLLFLVIVFKIVQEMYIHTNIFNSIKN